MNSSGRSRRLRCPWRSVGAGQKTVHTDPARRRTYSNSRWIRAIFFSGLARIDGEYRSIRVAVTPHDFVLFDNWTHLDPDTELIRLPQDSITDAVIVDETGNEVADQLLDPIRELETPEEERYAVVLKRHGANGELPPVSFLFRSGEPALECRDHYRRFISPRG
jgi:hypothetical protein